MVIVVPELQSQSSLGTSPFEEGGLTPSLWSRAGLILNWVEQRTQCLCGLWPVHVARLWWEGHQGPSSQPSSDPPRVMQRWCPSSTPKVCLTPLRPSRQGRSVQRSWLETLEQVKADA